MDSIKNDNITHNLSNSNLKEKSENLEDGNKKKEEWKKEINLSLDKNLKSKLKEIIKEYSFIILIIIPMILAVLIRLHYFNVPIADILAEDAYDYNLKILISRGVYSQFSSLPENSKQKLIEERFKEYLIDNKEQREKEIKILANELKESHRDEEGYIYPNGADPEYYLRYARNILNTGKIYTRILLPDKNIPQILMYPGYDAKKINTWHKTDFSKPVKWDDMRMAPIGSKAPNELHPYAIAAMHTLSRSKSFNLTLLYLELFLLFIAIILIFLIGRKLGGNTVGFLSTLIIVVQPTIVIRTISGDTDAYLIIFPLLIIWSIINAYTSKEIKKVILWACASGVSLGLFAFTWNTWWFILDLIILGAISILLYKIIYLKTSKYNDKIWHYIKKDCIIIGVFTTSAIILGSAFIGFFLFLRGIINPFLTLKSQDVINSVWPNVYTTVEELTRLDLINILNKLSFNGLGIAIHGKIILLISLLGLLYAILKNVKNKNKLILISGVWYLLVLITNFFLSNMTLFFILLLLPFVFVFLYSLWMKQRIKNLYIILILLIIFAGMYITTQGGRFFILFLPFLGIFLAIGLVQFSKALANYISKTIKIQEKIMYSLFLIMAISLFLLPLPSVFANLSVIDTAMNDQWYDTLKKIDNEALPDAIINSWWDFGHWFAYYGNRRVTFDGAGQDEHMAYWIGRSLYTNDEKHAAGILRMVDCGNNNAFWKLDSYINNTVISIDILNEIIVMNREKAKEYLTNYITPEQAEEVLQYSHCEPPENYYITSGDMIGKAGAWSHFGAWDFRKANLVFLATQNKKDEAVSFMMNEYGYDKNKAEQEYARIKSLGSISEADEWISESKGYSNKIRECLKIKEDTLACLDVIFNIKTEDAVITFEDGDKYPLKLAFVNKDGKFEVKEYSENLAKDIEGEDVGVIILQREEKYYAVLMRPDLVGSIFTRLHFFEGKDIKCFELFNHEIQLNKDKDIYTWKVNWSCLE